MLFVERIFQSKFIKLSSDVNDKLGVIRNTDAISMLHLYIYFKNSIV